MMESYAFLARKFEHVRHQQNFFVFISYKGHILYCCIRLVLRNMCYMIMIYHNKSKSLKTVFLISLIDVVSHICVTTPGP